ncbi:GNAT family N-acetyltransferase [Pengzhenrongella sicca]|uniref:GNAT family N-acetyltransferase n=1 Tax=Pengzhenrongella sicca TaxID=2819238 RepID=A0A8A4ZEY7_9MICO|nr:GNAT family N-acetyltransferase [Pengzhenrongella sicca]QTE30454.1 GNAT family N-acetyltransferase [Pengzhenrongella sicca]
MTNTTAAAPAGYRPVDLPAARRADVLAVDRSAFPASPIPDDAAPFPVPLDWTRTTGLEHADGTLAAIHSSYPFSLPVPGAVTACAGLTWVGVRPDHRRRGLLTAMIASHFDRSLARGEAVSALFAAEPAIYGRFGYGSAADDLHVTLGRGAALRPVPGSADLTLRLERMTAAAHGELVHRVHGRAGAGRPGWLERTTAPLQAAFLADPPSSRDGAEEQQIVTVRSGDDVRGYALLRRKEAWVDFSPQGVVRVAELVAVDPAATHRLWSFVLDLDLMSTIESPKLAADDVLLSLLVNVRVTRPRIADNVWIRLLDVPTALAARRYAAPLDAVFEVTDALLPANAGRWRVRTGTGGTDVVGFPAEVTPSTEPADLTVDVRELGAAYLGGRSLTAFAAAGLVTEHRPGALASATTAFGWPVAPLCSWTF